jgi:hypothetical protein
MVKPGDAGEGDDATSARRLDGARNRRIAVERHVGTVLVVVGRVGSNQSQQVALAEYDDMVEHLATEGADEPLSVSVLPRRGPLSPRSARQQVARSAARCHRRFVAGVAVAFPPTPARNPRRNGFLATTGLELLRVRPGRLKQRAEVGLKLVTVLAHGLMLPARARLRVVAEPAPLDGVPLA